MRAEKPSHQIKYKEHASGSKEEKGKKKTKIKLGKVFKDIIWPRKWILLIGLILIVS